MVSPLIERFSRPGRVAFLAACCIGLGACAAAIPVTADVAGAALEKAPEAVKAGKVQSHQPLGLDQMANLTRQAAAELDLKQTNQKISPKEVRFHYEDQKKQDIAITLTKRTSRVTQVQIDVGLFGDAGMAQILLRQILHDLPPGTPGLPAQAAADGPVGGAH